MPGRVEYRKAREPGQVSRACYQHRGADLAGEHRFPDEMRVAAERPAGQQRPDQAESQAIEMMMRHGGMNRAADRQAWSQQCLDRLCLALELAQRFADPLWRPGRARGEKVQPASCAIELLPLPCYLKPMVIELIAVMMITQQHGPR